MPVFHSHPNPVAPALGRFNACAIAHKYNPIHWFYCQIKDWRFLTHLLDRPSGIG
jgi:hypothetical protein